MKPLLIIPAVFLASCAAHTRTKPVPLTTTSPSRLIPGAGLRTAEQLREYRFGRYVDPGDSLVMHEAHPIYRVETSPDWNLRGTCGIARAQSASDPAPSVATNDSVVAEINKQRAITRAVTEQAATLNQRLGEMSKAAAQTQEVAKEGLTLKRDLAGLRERVDALDSQLRDRKPVAGERPAPRVEDKW